MARPKRVYPERLKTYTELMTKRVKMFSGVYITALHLLKRTEHYMISIESWASMISTFKTKIKHFVPAKVEIPVVSDPATLAFLANECWADWVSKEIEAKDSDMIETIAFLDNMFPDAKKVYFYELRSIVSAYCFGSFIRYKDDGTEDMWAKDIDQRKYYTHKYVRYLLDNPQVKELYNAYNALRDGEKAKKDKAFSAYHSAERDLAYATNDLTPVFKVIGDNVVIVPYIFTSTSVAKSNYENAGDIYFVNCGNVVYFETERHY